MGFEYSYDGRLMVGVGRSSYQKQFDGFLKYRLLRQTESNKMPLSVTLYSSMFMTTLKDPNKNRYSIGNYSDLKGETVVCKFLCVHIVKSDS